MRPHVHASDALAEAVNRIVQAVQPEQILLFGSHVWGQPNADSDIDLLVVLSASSQPGYRRAREVYRSLRGIRLPLEVIVRTRDEMTRAARVPTSLERQALERGRLLYG
ncbi:nucleotidyltransferase domain-containing protein [uncultured Thiocystis sp.]|jgi:predicted nucleotidyltransferase|uniref:nucleotidyltransferase domain-containing protein n=1 Tax=uncultured Thiocystis sp. TaxID=1202134 RepID=UPI0025D1DEE9|nr:nucleotidyltransferase domain-containing protein [uncultured Thiocystis sp.]